jgi:hypothetical protein
MDARRIAERTLEELEGIDLERPSVDEERARERLLAYVEALGLEEERVRFRPDIRALRRARVWPGRDRAHWQGLTGRQYWLLGRPLERGWIRVGGRWRVVNPVSVPASPGLERLTATDRTVLFVGLGRSDYVSGVRWVSDDLDAVARRILAEPSAAPKRVAALLPLAEAAAAGLFAFAVGCDGRFVDLVALVRPRMRFDEEGRLHNWDGLPAAEWQNGRGLYFWHGVEMTESAGRDPEAVTPARIARWANAERRRVAMERIGVEPFMHALGGTVVQQDDYGRLWRTEREIEGEPLVAVEVVNSTPEPDGSYRRYFLRVPPSVRTARRAVAWSFGLTRKVYAPVMES